MRIQKFFQSLALFYAVFLSLSASSHAQFRSRDTLLKDFQEHTTGRLKEEDRKIVATFEDRLKGGRSKFVEVLAKELKNDAKSAEVWDELLNQTIPQVARGQEISPEHAMRTQKISSILTSYFRIKGTTAVDDLPLTSKDLEQMVFGRRTTDQKLQGENGPNQWSTKELHNLARVLEHTATILEDSHTVTMKDALRRAYKEVGLKGNIDQCFK